MPQTKELNARQLKRLQSLYETEGKGMETCAAILGVPAGPVERAVAKHEWKRAAAKAAAELDKAQVFKLRALYEDQGRGLETCARVMGVHIGAVERAAVAHTMVRGTPQTAAKQHVPIEEQLQRTNLARHERDLLMASAGEKSLRATLEHLVTSVAQDFPAPPAYKAPTVKLSEVVDETLVLMLSDWHLYETVDPERVRHLNAYDSKIAGRRVRTIVSSLIAIKRKMERGGWRFPRLVVSLNGDLISGSIHEVERHSDAPSVVHAVYGAGLLLAQALRDLVAEFEEVEVFCTSGNHGRLPDARRVQQKDPLRSWDTLIAWMAKEHLRGCGERLRWHTPNSYSVMFEVEGWNFLQTHGHDVKSWNSIPWYGINRLVGNINALESARNVVVHHYLFGHFHTATSLPHAAGESFINGSLIGGTEFGVHGLGKADKPAQWLFGVHKDHGVTHRWPLLAEQAGATEGYDVRPWLHG